jgi:maleamate amidohydrolase
VPDAHIARRYEEAGIKQRLGFGTRPAVLVVDLGRAFTDPNHPLGSDLDDVIDANLRLLDRARERAIPIIFTTIAFHPSMADAGVWVHKSPVLRELLVGTRAVEIDDRLGVRDGEPVVVKKGASAFFGTNVASMLAARRVDTVIVTGVSTSGCVRATMVDAVQYGFRGIVPRECVGDRAEEPHEASLFDIDAKYGDVLDLDEVIGTLEEVTAP